MGVRAAPTMTIGSVVMDKFPFAKVRPSPEGDGQARYCMLMMMVFLWVKCSSMDSSDASLPRPDALTPP